MRRLGIWWRNELGHRRICAGAIADEKPILEKRPFRTDTYDTIPLAFSAQLKLLTDPSKPTLSYRDAGVDISAGDELVDRIKPLVKRTWRPNALVALVVSAGYSVPVDRYQRPILVSGTDGVGTKLKLAVALGETRFDRHRSRRHVRQ